MHAVPDIDLEHYGKAIARGERYLKAGADGVCVEGPESIEELREVGAAFKGIPLATSVGSGVHWSAQPYYFASRGEFSRQTSAVGPNSAAIP
jgi:2-methylisocitrate lyase-like PEP mutase family enzyme